MLIINSDTLNIRTWSDQHTDKNYYQFFIGTSYAADDIEVYGDDVRYGGRSLFFSEGDCTQGEYIDILVEQVTFAIKKN